MKGRKTKVLSRKSILFYMFSPPVDYGETADCLSYRSVGQRTRHARFQALTYRYHRFRIDCLQEECTLFKEKLILNSHCKEMVLVGSRIDFQRVKPVQDVDSVFLKGLCQCSVPKRIISAVYQIQGQGNLHRAQAS